MRLSETTLHQLQKQHDQFYTVIDPLSLIPILFATETEVQSLIEACARNLQQISHCGGLSNWCHNQHSLSMDGCFFAGIVVEILENGITCPNCSSHPTCLIVPVVAHICSTSTIAICKRHPVTYRTLIPVHVHLLFQMLMCRKIFGVIHSIFFYFKDDLFGHVVWSEAD